MSQEEQLLHLSDLYQTSHTDYDRNGASTQLLLTESVNDTGIQAVDSAEIRREGGLEGTSYLWRSVGNKLYLWDNCDKSHTRCCTMIPSDQSITAVGLAHIVAGTKISFSAKYWLVVSTISNVSLFYFDPDTVSSETPPMLSGYVAPTGDTVIISVSRPNKFGRIFLGGTDGSVFEFVHHPLSTVSLVSQLFGQNKRRCYLSIITKPWGTWLGPIRSLIGLSKISGGNRVLSISADPCRSLLYVLKKCAVEVYDLDSLQLQTELSYYTIAESVKSAQRSSSVDSSSQDGLVELIPSNPHIGGDILFVLVTRSGARVFVRRNNPGFLRAGIPPSQQLSIPCKFCQKNLSRAVSAVSIACVKLPERHPHLDIVSAYSPNGGRCIFMVSSNTSGGGGVVVVRPDESSIASRQQTSSTHLSTVRERYDFVPLGDVRYSILISSISSRVPMALQELAPSDGLYSVASDDLRLNGAGNQLVVITSDSRQIEIIVPKVSEIVVDFLSSVGPNLAAARDLSMQFGSDQFASQLFSVLIDVMTLSSGANSSTFFSSSGQREDGHQISLPLIERVLFDIETAAAMGFVDGTVSGMNGGRRWTPGSSMHQEGTIVGGPLGSVVHSSTQNISNRTRGLGLFLSRLLRPIWLAKAFKLEYGSSSSVMTLRPILSSTQRTYMSSLLKPVVDMLTTYRQQLVNGITQYENKIVEGMMVLASAILECMELLRLFETGQLTPQIVDAKNTEQVFANLDTLCIRDLVLSVGVGNEFIMEFVSAILPSESQNMLRKHCPLLIPRI